MGQTVVFTVPLDADGEVAIGRTESGRPPRHPFRRALRDGLANRGWRVAALVVLVAPIVAGAVTWLVTGGEWTATAALLTAALVLPAVAAGAAANGSRQGGAAERVARELDMAEADEAEPTGDRLVRVTVVGGLGAALALATLPVAAWAIANEGWNETAAVPTLGVLALAGASGAWFGLALGTVWRRGAAWPVASGAVVALSLVPLGLFAAAVPTTVSADQVDTYVFASRYQDSFTGPLPSYVCDTETVEIMRAHTDRVAWIAFGSPVAWAVDAATFSPAELAVAPNGTVAQAQAWTRSTRQGPDAFTGYCYRATSLGIPLSVRQARYEQASPMGATLALLTAVTTAGLAVFAVSRRRSA